jgi:hypothetical protein
MAASDLTELRRPPIIVYADYRDHREIILCPHKPRTSSGVRSTSGTDTPKITIYNRSTKG